jgi:repressor LexA
VSTAYLTGDSDFRSEQDAVIAKWTAEQASGLSDEVRRIEAGIRIPVLGEVPCGVPIEAIEMVDTDDWEEIPEKLARTGTFYGLIAKGDSMSPRIQAGDVLIIKQQSTAESGDVVIAKVNGEEATCKRLVKQEGGIVLQPFNPAYSPMYFSNAEILSKPVLIVGKVIENRQKF